MHSNALERASVQVTFSPFALERFDPIDPPFTSGSTESPYLPCWRAPTLTARPVPRLPSVVRHGNDFNEVGAIKIDDAEWKLAKDTGESARAVAASDLAPRQYSLPQHPIRSETRQPDCRVTRQYQTRAASASSAASGCSRTARLTTRCAREACLHHFPRNACTTPGSVPRRGARSRLAELPRHFPRLRRRGCR